MAEGQGRMHKELTPCWLLSPAPETSVTHREGSRGVFL